MKFSKASKLENRKAADILIVPFWEGKKHAEQALNLENLQQSLYTPIETGDFKGKKGETALIYLSSQKEKRCLLLGLGKEKDINRETLRRAFSIAIKVCISKKSQKVNIALPNTKKLSNSELGKAISEGLLLSNYSFDELKKETPKKELSIMVSQVCFIGASKDFIEASQKASLIAEGVNFARDIVNRSADVVTPLYLSEAALNLEQELSNVTAKVFDKKQIEKEGMGLLLAVNKGSSNEPRFIILEYTGNPKSKDKTVIVGKGVTFDAGGMNLKPTGHMETMRSDMAGGAAAMGTIIAASKTGIKANITAVIPATENCIGSKSYKCGDIYTSYSGKTVEIINTDAEGRLILADALAYTCKNLNPTRIIDIATLTGAIEIALGQEAAGLMANDNKLAKNIEDASHKSSERVWRLPLFEEYKELLKSDIADIKNCGTRGAGSITAALFLEAFVDKKTPWAHLDIAGVAFMDKPLRYQPKNATGWGIRLLVETIENLS